MGMESTCTGESRRRPAQGDPAQAAGGGRERCPRCESRDTKFCYYNNYNMSQPRHFCKSCRRYWTLGGTLRNVPVGGASRKRLRPSLNPADCRPAGRSLLPPPSAGLVGLSSDLPAGHGSLLPGVMRLDEPFLPGLGLGLGIGCGSGAAEEMGSFGLGHGMLWGSSQSHSLLDESGDAWRVGSGVGGVDYFVTSGPATSGAWTDLAISAPADASGVPGSSQ